MSKIFTTATRQGDRSLTRKHARVTLSREFQVGGGVQAFRAKLGGRFPRVGQARRGGFEDCTRAGGRRGPWGAVRGSAQSDKETKDCRDFFFTSALLHYF